MIFHQVPDLVEPEKGQARENFPLTGNGIGKNDVERRYPVRRHDEKGFPEIVDVPHLSPAPEGQPREIDP